jgi:hypothetical protein
VTQPTLWRKDLPDELRALLWSRPVGLTGRAISAGELARGMREYNDTMRRFCRTESVECIDLAARFPKDGTVFIDDEHFNEAGARLVAEVIAEHFVHNLNGIHGIRSAKGK